MGVNVVIADTVGIMLEIAVDSCDTSFAFAMALIIVVKLPAATALSMLFLVLRYKSSRLFRSAAVATGNCIIYSNKMVACCDVSSFLP